MNTLTFRMLLLMGALTGLTVFSGCGGGGSTSISDPGNSGSTNPHITASSHSGTTLFFNKVSAPASDADWNQVLSPARTKGIPLEVIGIDHPDSTGGPQIDFTITRQPNNSSGQTLIKYDFYVAVGDGISTGQFFTSDIVTIDVANKVASCVIPGAKYSNVSEQISFSGALPGVVGQSIAQPLFDETRSVIDQMYLGAISQAASESYQRLVAV